MSSDTPKTPDVVEAVADAIGEAWNSAPYVGWDELARAAIAALAATQVDAGPLGIHRFPVDEDGSIWGCQCGAGFSDDLVGEPCPADPRNVLLARCAALEAERDAAVARAEKAEAELTRPKRHPLTSKHMCDNCGNMTRDTTAGCDHCDLEDK